FDQMSHRSAPEAQIEEPGKARFVRRDQEKLFENDINFVEASRISTQSVVFIKTLSAGRSSDFSLFDFYFGDGLGSRKSIGTGSGVIFTNNGYIVTNYHVIEDAEKIEVIHQKKTYEAEIVGTDPSSDLAIIKVEAKNLPSIKRGSARELEIGEWVIAVGNPFNLTSTVTAGIVSAKGRNIGLLGGQFPIESFIQTDAPINPGNSGGALVNIKGELVGINTAILSRTGSYTGYGFAVPVDIVAKIFNDIIQYGQVQKAFAGLEISEIDSETDEKLGLNLENFEGVVVTEVQEGSDAEKLGIKSGDVILKINEEKIDGRSAYEEMVSYYRPGDQLTFTYRRGANIKTAKITLTNREGTTGILKSEIYSAERIGGDLEPVSKIEKDKLGIESGVRVVKIRNGLLRRLRIQEGFIITSINKQEISKPEEVEQILSSINGRVYIEGIDKNGVRGYYSYYF
ncbi:MAG: trypsin-like peptidase domain-containing protein, partial [Bacteroidota bacterium]